MAGLMGGMYRISEWIMRFAYLHILWICFTLVGLGVFGLFPSTTAMFAVNRKWVMGEPEIPVFKTFWKTYKMEFLKSNLMGLILLGIGFILYMDYRYLVESHSTIGQILYFPLLAFIFLFGLLLLYVFPVFVHYDIKIFQVIKNSLLMMVLYPLSTIMMVIGSLIVYLAMTFFPGLIPFFGIGIMASVITWSAHHALAKNDRILEVPQNE